MNKNKKEKGLTLIELAIAMIIIGLLMIGITQAFKIYVIQKQQAALKEAMSSVKIGISDYIARDPDPADAIEEKLSRYPCPADPAAPPGSASFGAEQRDGSGDCQATGAIREVTVAGGGKVYIGTVPTRTLEISSAYMMDPWNDRFTYAVSGNLAAATKPLEQSNPTGNIEIQMAAGTPMTGQHFALLSHGRDGAGAYTRDGVLDAAPCNTSLADGENCDGDAVFSQVDFSTGQNASYYDDTLSFQLAEGLDDQWWKATDNTNRHITNKNTGNVGIGTDDPQVRLDVAGASTGTSGGNIRLTNTDPSLTNGQYVNELQFYQSDTSGGGHGVSNALRTISIPRIDDNNYYGTAARLGVFVSGHSSGQVNNNALLEAMTFYPGGNVGIGTASPERPLDVAEGAIQLRAGAVRKWLLIGQNSPDYFAIQNLTAGTIPFMIQGASHNVGIGTTNPTEKLDVAGKIKSITTDAIIACGSQGKVYNGTGCVGVTPDASEDINVSCPSGKILTAISGGAAVCSNVPGSECAAEGKVWDGTQCVPLGRSCPTQQLSIGDCPAIYVTCLAAPHGKLCVNNFANAIIQCWDGNWIHNNSGGGCGE